MTAVTQVLGTRTSLTFSGLSTLANANYVQSTSPYVCATADPVDVLVELNAGVGSSPSSNKQALVFIRYSLDGSNYTTGPTSGTTTTDEPDLIFLGALPIMSTTAQRGVFSILKVLGFVPYDFYVVIKNETGQTFNAGAVATCEVSQVF